MVQQGVDTSNVCSNAVMPADPSMPPSTWPGRHTHPCHVWVTDTPARRPGLLLMWRRGRHGWEGWVVSADYHAAHEHLSVRQGWVDARSIEQV